METWKNGNLKKMENLDKWKFGKKEFWKNGNVENGNVENWNLEK